MTRMSALSHALIGAAAAALALAAALPAAAQLESAPDVEAQVDTRPMTKGEKRLAKLLEGRVAGEPIRCIRTLPSQRMQTIDSTAYVYGSGSTIYLQRTRNPDQISDNDALVTRRFEASQLCRLDVATTIDRVLGQFTGAVFFEDFVPYTRVKAEPKAKG
jgi:hypothetical protein